MKLLQTNQIKKRSVDLMKNIKKLVAVVVSVCVIGAAGMVYAAELKTPADIAAALTGKSVTDVTKEKVEGKTYGTIASEAGKLEEFKAQMLEQRKAVLDQRVKDGEITQQQADDIYNAIKNNQATCDGTGNAKVGKQNGMGCGNGQGAGRGQGMMGRGAGSGNGGGNGAGCGMGYNQ
jgi:hypothetical protein